MTTKDKCACLCTPSEPTLERRSFLQFSLGTLATLALPINLAWGQMPTPSHPTARACILLWLEGGPSHIDTFDPKPGNGPVHSIRTAAEGIELCENLPNLAERMNRAALIRSLSSAEGNHQRARYLVHTGYSPTPTIKHPSMGAIVSSEIGNPNFDLPNFITILGASESSGFLGVEHAPFFIQNPTSSIANLEPPRGVNDARFQSRLALSQRLDAGFRQTRAGRDVDAHRTITDRTVRFMESDLTAAFDLEREPQAVRDKYGDSDFGQGTLMARRLIQAGAPFVEVTLKGWDTHEDNFNRVADLCAQLDFAISALMDDLIERDLFDQVLVVTMGEFGRTPRINGREGRDHWPQAWSALMAGGGVRGGQVIGATDEEGGEVVDRPIRVPDLMASIFHALSVDYQKWNDTPVGRPIQIADHGRVIDGLFA